MPGYISEVDYDGGAASNFVEVVVPAGTDVSAYSLVIYDNDGTIIETFSFGTPAFSISGNDVYLFDDNDPNWVDIHNNEAIALVDDTGTVLQFIAFKDPVTAVEGPADGQSATQIGEHSGGDESLVTSDGGSSYGTTTTSTPGTIPCFALGTLISTPEGPRPVETLRPGDLVNTLHGGHAPVFWFRQSTHWFDGPEAEGRPILISAGSLGPDRPQSDLVVSPQHRVVVGSEHQLPTLFNDHCFVPAKALTGLPGIREMRGKDRITWVHFACKPHQVVTSNGCHTESLFLGPMVTNRLTVREMHEIEQLFGPLGQNGWNGPLALPAVSVGRARRIIEKGRKARGQAA